jgi:pyruvate/2-oxoglutarate dehydrogenase complex dihydrolipoamide acyltransferase (E2) component
MRLLKVSSIALVFGLLIAAPVVAQESPVAEDGRVLTSAAMDAALAGHESAVDQQRAELARLLSQPQVQRLADDHGIDIGQVESAAAGLSDSQMEQIAPLVAMVTPIGQNALGTVTISVAAIIIILLILILVT